MTCCPHCQDSEAFFSDWTARRDLRRYRKKGPLKTTRMLLDALRPRLSGDETLLDVGGGVGVIQHELLQTSIAQAVHVDASHAYLAVSESESIRLGHAGRVTYRFGDLVEFAHELAPADVVTLDRVICCYPHMEALVEASVHKTRRLCGLVFPRETWAAHSTVTFSNLYFRLRRTQFRTYVHPVGAVLDALARFGLKRVYAGRTFMWNVAVFERSSVNASLSAWRS